MINYCNNWLISCIPALQKLAANDSPDHSQLPTIPPLPPSRSSPLTPPHHPVPNLPPARPANSPPVHPPPSPPRSRSPIPFRPKHTPPLPDLRGYSQPIPGDPTPRPGGGGAGGGRAVSAPPVGGGGYNNYDERTLPALKQWVATFDSKCCFCFLIMIRNFCWYSQRCLCCFVIFFASCYRWQSQAIVSVEYK